MHSNFNISGSYIIYQLRKVVEVLALLTEAYIIASSLQTVKYG